MLRFDARLAVYSHRDAMDFRMNTNVSGIVGETVVAHESYSRRQCVGSATSQPMASKFTSGTAMVPIAAQTA